MKNKGEAVLMAYAWIVRKGEECAYLCMYWFILSIARIHEIVDCSLFCWIDKAEIAHAPACDS